MCVPGPVLEGVGSKSAVRVVRRLEKRGIRGVRTVWSGRWTLESPDYNIDGEPSFSGERPGAGNSFEVS